jgi:hypothetical protein
VWFSREQKHLVRRATVSLVFMIWDARTTCGSARRQLIEQSLHAIIPQNHLHAAPLGIPGHWPFAIKRCFLERIKIRKWHRLNVSNPLVFLRALPQRSLKLAIIYIYACNIRERILRMEKSDRAAPPRQKRVGRLFVFHGRLAAYVKTTLLASVSVFD